jgi:peptidoglycan/LPS O-acetylase OafA/YrhL
MDPVSPFFALAALLVALGTTFLIVRHDGPPAAQGRFASIDGLRGYLAFFVFLHHGSIWYFYARTGTWKEPPSNLYTHFGHSSVALFFMITAFLFFSKLLEARTKGMDWGRFFVSRFLRLAPLYLFAVVALLVIVLGLSNGTLNEPVSKVAHEVTQWLGFTILGEPDINGLEHTKLILAGVTWSLPYEWFFYFALPLLALTVAVRPPLPYLLISLAAMVGLVFWKPQAHNLVSFAGGIAAALLVRLDIFRRFASTPLSSWVVAGCLVLTVVVFPTGYGAMPLLLIAAAFSIIAAGSTLFGILVHPVSRALGEVAYSLYLLHGLVLFVAFDLVTGVPLLRTLSPLQHWLIVLGLTPLLVGACFLTFRFIERPAMQRTASLTAWLTWRRAALS